jgi:hypothetical protein
MRRPSTSLLIVMMFVLSLVAAIPSAAQAKPEKAAPSAAAKPSLGDFDDFVNRGVTIEFKRDASGKVTEAALNDNGTAMVLKKK